MVSGLAWRTECQKASTVWPDRLRPARSVRVIDTITGSIFAARLARLVGGDEGGLGVQRVEHRLDQDEVDAAVQQPVDLLAIDALHFVEGDGAIAGIVDVGRDRQRLVGRAERAGDEARLVGSFAVAASAQARVSLAAARLISRAMPAMP